MPHPQWYGDDRSRTGDGNFKQLFEADKDSTSGNKMMNLKWSDLIIMTWV
jgi:hypothetical protein